MSDTSNLLLTLQPKMVARATKQLARAAAMRSNASERIAAEQRHIQLRLDNIDDAALFTYLDPVHIFKVLVNLLQNGIKFTPDGGEVILRARAMAGFIEVTVADTGIGVATENQERIFHTFSSLGNVAFHSTSKTKFKGGGLGLGLPISRGIIEAHGGTLWVESAGHDEEKCPGSIFHLMLPIRQEPPTTDGEWQIADSILRDE